MFRNLIVMVCVLALAAPAFAVVNAGPGAGPFAIDISLTIPAFTNIWWQPTGAGHSQDGNDQTIVFNSIVQDGSNEGDWWRGDLTGPYGPATKASTDAFAMDYYESFDFATFWMESNCNTSMVLTSGGDLTNGAATLPTWYTVALTNNANCTFNTDCGFIDGGTRYSDGIIPLGGGMGSFADDANADYAMELFGGAFYGSQFSFPMVDVGGNTVYTGNFTAYAEGTILIHGRVLRAGLADPAGAYTTTLWVSFF